MQVSTQTSSFIDYICSDLLRGRVTVYLKDGSRYQYTNVSRRAILNLQLQPNISLGFWFNHNIIDDVRVNAQRSFLMNYAWFNVTIFHPFFTSYDCYIVS